jgi:hypothetical protein
MPAPQYARTVRHGMASLQGVSEVKLILAKLKAAKAELKIRQRAYNAAQRDLDRVLKAINELEKKAAKMVSAC